MEDAGAIVITVISTLVAVLGLVNKARGKKAFKNLSKPDVRPCTVEETDSSQRDGVTEGLPEEAPSVFTDFPQEAVEAPEKKERLKIDKRNLVIYSEIMKPKFD